MSVINRKPFINEVLDTLTVAQLATLKNLVDGSGDEAVLRSLLPQSTNLLTEDDQGVKRVQLEVTLPQYAAQSTYTGYLIYNDTYCVLIAYNNDSKYQLLTMINITLTSNGKWTFEPVNEELTILGLRSELDDVSQSEEAEAVSAVSTALDDGDLKIVSDNLDSDTATSGQVLTADGNGGASWQDAGGGIDAAEEEGQVLVANSDLEAEWQDYVPYAENLTGNKTNNDSLYVKGPTGGSADISTGEEAYLQEVKGYSIVWNQLIDSSSITTDSTHIYVRVASDGTLSLIRNSATSVSTSYKLYDLTLMFGSNDNIPFSLTGYTEYVANGYLPAQTYTAVYGFARLFAGVDLVNASYDAGTLKYVNATSLTEEGQNLWNADDEDMTENGLQLLAGYRYEIYRQTGYDNNVWVYGSKNGGNSWTSYNMASRVALANGEYIRYIAPTVNMLIKATSTYPILYVGYVHSGNYCLTQPSSTSDIPSYESHIYSISNASNLKGIPDSSDNHSTVYDTVDTTRVGSIDLSTLTWTDNSGSYSATISDMAEDTTALLSDTYLQSSMSVSGTTITITTSASPTGTLLYELATEVSTGNTFEPIAIEVNDMGQETFSGVTYCPVNQISQYVENLRDKLVNLDLSDYEVESIPWSANYTYLLGLKINGTTYKLPYMVDPTDNSTVSEGRKQNCVIMGYQAYAFSSGANVVIGYSSQSSYSSNTVAIGYQAITGNYTYRSPGGVSIGSQASTYASYAVSLGSNVYNYVPYSVSFDGTSSTYQRTLQLYDASKIFFRNAVVSTSYTSFDSYTNGHYLSEYINLTELTLTESDDVYTSSETFTAGTGLTAVHVVIKVSGSSTHSVVSLDLLPYDSTNSYSFDSYARVNVDGTVSDILATIDSTGAVVITAPSGATIDSASYHLLG